MTIGNKFKAASNVVTSKAGRQLLKTQKHSPTLLFGAGVVGVVATTVLASRATLKLDAILESNEHKMDQANLMRERARLEDLPEDETYTEQEHKKDMTVLKVRLVKDICKLYAPAFGVGVLSIGALTGSHVILTNRYTGAVAAYSALEKSVEQYRARVTDLVGVDKERELRFGSEQREIKSEDGKKVDTVTRINEKELSQYAKVFAQDTSQSWDPRAEYNLMFLRAQQNWANDTLKAKGHLFLNEVYDNLGLERTPAGAVTGWVLNNKRNPEANGYVDFGIFSGETVAAFIEFFQGTDGAIWLDFNVDGVVYDLI